MLTQWSWLPSGQSRETSCPLPQLSNWKCRGRRTMGLKQRKTENSSDFQMWRKETSAISQCITNSAFHGCIMTSISQCTAILPCMQVHQNGWFCVYFSVWDKTTCINNLVKLWVFLSLVFTGAYWHHYIDNHITAKMPIESSDETSCTDPSSFLKETCLILVFSQGAVLPEVQGGARKGNNFKQSLTF